MNYAPAAPDVSFADAGYERRKTALICIFVILQIDQNSLESSLGSVDTYQRIAQRVNNALVS